MSKQDRNTAVTIGIVLIVCTITLVAIGSFVWQIIAPGVAVLGEVLGTTAFTIRADYNFAIPAVSAEGSNSSSQSSSSATSSASNSSAPAVEYNYNFKLPKRK